MKPTRPLTGLVAAVHTPFRPDGSLHLDVVEAQAAHLQAHGIDLAFVGGSTGEGHSLSLEERRALARRWVEVARGTALGVVVHVGANCLADSRALAAQAEGRVPTLAGIKFTSPDLMAYQLCLRGMNGAFDVPYGVDEWLLAALALGARGAVGSTYNFAAPLYRRMLRAFAACDLATAREEQLRSVQLVRLESVGFFDWIRPRALP